MAAIRRLIVISAEAPDAVDTTRFDDMMLQMGILVGAIVALGITIAVLPRHAAPQPGEREAPAG